MDDVKWIHALIEISKRCTVLVEEMGSPCKNCETPEPCVKTVDEATKNGHLIMKNIVFDPSAVHVRNSILVLLKANEYKLSLIHI